MKLIITTNLGHLKVYQVEKEMGQSTPTVRLVQELNFPDAHRHYDDMVTDQAGRFPIANGANSSAMAIGEENDFEIEVKRRLIDQIVINMEKFLHNGQGAKDWNFAAPSAINHAILEKLPVTMKQKLRKNLDKDLTKIPPLKVLSCFENAA
ncbi:MAG: host attachment protein [Verrucomicrobiia bacterium]